MLSRSNLSKQPMKADPIFTKALDTAQFTRFLSQKHENSWRGSRTHSKNTERARESHCSREDLGIHTLCLPRNIKFGGKKKKNVSPLPGHPVLSLLQLCAPLGPSKRPLRVIRSPAVVVRQLRGWNHTRRLLVSGCPFQGARGTKAKYSMRCQLF